VRHEIDLAVPVWRRQRVAVAAEALARDVLGERDEVALPARVVAVPRDAERLELRDPRVAQRAAHVRLPLRVEPSPEPHAAVVAVLAVAAAVAAAAPNLAARGVVLRPVDV